MSPGSSSSSCCAARPGYADFRRALSVPVQFLLRRRRPASCAAAARPDHAAERRGRRRLSRACRCRGRAADRNRAGRRTPRTCLASSRSACITSSSIRNCCSPTSCTPSRRIRPIRPMTPTGRCRSATARPRGYVEVPAGIRRSAMTATGFCFDNETPRHDELDRRRAHRAPSGHQCRMARVHRRPAATRRRRSGCPTAGPPCRRKAGRRRAIGGSDDGGWHALTLGRAASRSIRAAPVVPCQLLRGRGFRALCRQASAERGGMGGRRARRA